MPSISKSIPSKQEPYTKNSRRKFLLSAGNFKVTLGEKTCVMGIINCTPDSFSQDGCIKNEGPLRTSIRLAKRMIKEGVDILDVGGESSRPGANRISFQEEITRVIPTINKLAKSTDIPISIDTYKPEVAQHALDNGAVIINNICGANPSQSLLKMIKSYDAAIVLMHMRGTPKTMQNEIAFSSLIDDIIFALRNSIEKCLEIGIKSDRIIIDPGIGFGKTVENNLTILNRLEDFKTLRKPLLIGTSRKSFIGKVLSGDVDKRLYGSLASVSASIVKGAHIVRVHDVKETKQTALLTDAIVNGKA